MTIQIADADNLTPEEGAEIRKHVLNGTIWDCLIRESGGVGRVVGVIINDTIIHYYSAENESIKTLDYDV